MRFVEPGTDVEYEKHPLDDAKSPLIRVLPAFERNFRRHALWAKAFADAASARLAQANQLLEEMASCHNLMPTNGLSRKHNSVHVAYLSFCCLNILPIHARQHAQICTPSGWSKQSAWICM